jgi:hypothetical protein
MSNHTRFTYSKSASQAPLARVLGWRPAFSTDDVPSADFIRCLSAAQGSSSDRNHTSNSSTSCSHVYFSCSLAHVALHGLRGHLPKPAAEVEALLLDATLLDPVPALAAEDETMLRKALLGGKASPPSRDATQQFVWLGGSTVATPTHFDDSHNVYVQLAGVKRFYLFPPWRHRDLAVYPVSHPHDRQSQVKWSPDLAGAALEQERREFRHLWAQVVEGGSQGGVLCATLQPGDALWLPAGWFHYVEALTPSASLNTWTPAAASVLLGELFANMLPFAQKGWSADQKQLVVERYAPMVVEDVVCGTLHQSKDRGEASDQDEDAFVAGGRCIAHHLRGGALVGCGEAARDYVRGMLDDAYSPQLMQDLRAAGHQPDASCSLSRGRGLDVMLRPYVNDVVRTFQAMEACARMVYLGIWLQALLGLVSHPGSLPQFASRCLRWSGVPTTAL